MNYYELFKIPISFEVDQKLLTKSYYALSKEHHPDKFTLKPTKAQIESLKLSTEINKGFKILGDRQNRIKYLLEVFGVKFIEGQEKVSQSFLMEMMDINEELMEYQFDPDPQKKESILKSIEDIEISLNDRITPVMADIDINNPDMDALSLIKDYYLKSQYLRRLRVNLIH